MPNHFSGCVHRCARSIPYHSVQMKCLLSTNVYRDRFPNSINHSIRLVSYPHTQNVAEPHFRHLPLSVMCVKRSSLSKQFCAPHSADEHSRPDSSLHSNASTRARVTRATSLRDAHHFPALVPPAPRCGCARVGARRQSCETGPLDMVDGSKCSAGIPMLRPRPLRKAG